jgi:hypothetical protein
MAYCSRSKSHKLLGNIKEAKFDLETAGLLIKQGKTKGLSKDNLLYIEKSLEDLISLEQKLQNL